MAAAESWIVSHVPFEQHGQGCEHGAELEGVIHDAFPFPPSKGRPPNPRPRRFAIMRAALRRSAGNGIGMMDIGMIMRPTPSRVHMKRGSIHKAMTAREGQMGLRLEGRRLPADHEGPQFSRRSA